MGAIDYWIQASKRPSCLMAVSPYQGGAWLSPMRAGVAYPSEILRNFADEPAYWYDVTPAMASIGTNDFEWAIDSQCLDASGGGAVYYNSTGTPSYNTIGWYVYAADVRYSGFISHTGLVSDPVETYYNSAIVARDILISTVRKSFSENIDRVIVKIKRIGGVVSIYVNGVLAKTITGSAPIALTNTSTGELRSNASCNIYSVYLRNDTIGKTIWSYPTWAEEKRLLTYNNVRTDRGIFEAADTSLIWSIKTQLTGTVGTVIERRTTGIYVNSGKFNATTGIYTGLATDQLIYLLAFDYVLTAAEIAQFK